MIVMKLHIVFEFIVSICKQIGKFSKSEVGFPHFETLSVSSELIISDYSLD